MRAREELGIKPQPRDIALLRGLFESRVMTLAHITALHFDGRPEAAKKRVQKLKAAGLIRERPRRVNDPSIHFLSWQALNLLNEHGVLSQYPQFSLTEFVKRAHVSNLTLRHELDVMDVKTAMVTAITATPKFEVEEFCTWPAIHQFSATRSGGERVKIKPDGFIRIREREPDGARYEHTFFLEVDRSTEKPEILIERTACYRDYYRRGGLAVRNGKPASDYEQFPFRILIILKSEDRRDNIAKRLLELSPPILTQVWLTALQDFLGDSLGPVWLRPLDYRSTLYDDTGNAKQRSMLLGR